MVGYPRDPRASVPRRPGGTVVVPAVCPQCMAGKHGAQPPVITLFRRCLWRMFSASLSAKMSAGEPRIGAQTGLENNFGFVKIVTMSGVFWVAEPSGATGAQRLPGALFASIGCSRPQYGAQCGSLCFRWSAKWSAPGQRTKKERSMSPDCSGWCRALARVLRPIGLGVSETETGVPP